MTSVSSSTSPVAAGGIPLAGLDAPPASEGKARAAAATSVMGDVVLEPAASKSAASKTAKGAKTSASKKKTATTKKSGYATSGSLPKDLAFLRDPKLSMEEKLVRLAAYLGARYDAELQKKMELIGGPASKASGTGGTKGSGTKKKGFWGTLLDTAKVALPALGLSMQVLKNPTTKAMLKQLGGPVLAAAATAFGFPQAASVLARLGPQIVDYAAAGLQAVEKAASAEKTASASGGTTAGSSSSVAGSSSAPGGTVEQTQLMEIQLLLNKQREMFTTLSNMLRTTHETRTQMIANLR